ncbi:MAG TPA: serine hydrolase domain-containing protein [Jatrophihabitans sp.]|nr:serine hydrolase domain-containing protein [Jatrophihabitans sp.]
MAASRFDPVWTLLDRQRAGGRFPGYVAGIRQHGRTELRAGGTLAIEGRGPMRPDTIFRIASLTKPVAGVLALSLIGDGVFGLDDPVARWLPELAAPRVLRHADAELSDTVAAERPVLVRHLLSLTFGLGSIRQPSPLQAAITERGVGPEKFPPAMTNDEYLARIGSLPLAFQPGDGWLYHTGSDVLGVLIARASGKPVSTLLAERITGPLGMDSTAFFASDPHRLATGYQPVDGRLELRDPPNGVFSRPPMFEALGSGLVSTVGDYLAFLSIFTDPRDDVLAPELRTLMITDSLDGRQRAAAQEVLGRGRSWGLQVAVTLPAAGPKQPPGRFGWDGGSGTTGYVDLRRDVTAVLFTQRGMVGPSYDFEEFWRAVRHCAR